MQSLIDRDHAANGEWTAFSAPLERSVLKMGRYLEDDTPPSEPESAVPGPASAQVRRQPPIAHPTKPEPLSPGPAAGRPTTGKRTTEFGEKLLSAISQTQAAPED
jgi:hypothetical protein